MKQIGAMGRDISRVTRREVALAAGTSEAVVSYVVNNGPRPVSSTTRQKVLDAIADTAYRPNTIARSLAAGSTKTYGLIVPNIRNPFLAALAHALQQEIFSSGRVLLLGDSDDNKVREREILRTFIERRVDGIVWYGVDRDVDMREAHAAGVPVVVLDKTSIGSEAASVFINETGAAFAATKHLLDHGRKSVGIISGPRKNLNSQDRISGWRQALELNNIGASDNLTFEGDYTRGGGYAAARTMFSGMFRPDAVFVSNELQALGLLAAAAECGVRIPEDLAVVCFNGTINSAFSTPTLTAIEQPVETIAKASIKILLQSGPFTAEAIECDFLLRRRASCGCDYERNTFDKDV
jgi:LacI family transcriptional regulator